MSELADSTRQAIAALGAPHQQLLAALSNPNAPNTLFISSDPRDNDVTLQIDTTIATRLTAGATPVPPDDAPGSTFSLLYLDLTNLNLTDDEFKGITVPNDWVSQKYGRQICLAPKSDQPLSPGTGAGLGVKLPGFTMANPPPGTDAHLILTYFNVAGITVGDLGTPHDLKVLFQRPPDAKDRDLHGDLLLTLAPPSLVACSLKGYDPVSNTVSMIFQPNPEGGPPIAGSTSLFEVTFVYADNPPGYGALCAAADITGPVRGTNADQWTLQAGAGKANPSWLLGPPAGKPIVGSGAAATVSFDFDSIVTWLAPGPTLLLVSYSNIPGYNDGSFQIPIVKVAHPDIEGVRATPNPAQLEDPAGVDVVIDWTVHDAGKLTLYSSADVPEPVTGSPFWKETLSATTKFRLEADGKFLAEAGNVATKSVNAVVTPHIEFSATILPDPSRVQLTWNVCGAETVEIDNVPGIQKLAGSIILPALTPDNPLPYNFTLKAFVGRNEAGTASIKRTWGAGPSISLDGNLIVRNTNATGFAVSPDGKKLYAAVADSFHNFSVSVFDATSLKLIESMPLGLVLRPGFAFSPNSSQLYVLSANPGDRDRASVMTLSAQTYKYIDTVMLPDFAAGHYEALALAANDKYIFIKTNGARELVVLDAHTRALVWSDTVPNPQTSISTGLALTEKRFYYTGDNVIKVLDCQTLAVLKPAPVSMSNASETVQLVAAHDDSRTFLTQFKEVLTFQGSDWLNPARLSSCDGSNGCRGIGVSSDCRQVFLLCSGNKSYVQIQEFDLGAGTYGPVAGLLQGAGVPAAIAMAPDDTRVFVGLLDASERNASLSVLDAGYVREA
jgi:hypothetical protein